MGKIVIQVRFTAIFLHWFIHLVGKLLIPPYFGEESTESNPYYWEVVLRVIPIFQSSHPQSGSPSSFLAEGVRG